MSKQEAHYLPKAPDARHPCMICRYYDALAGGCEKVEGIIRPWACCDLWRGRA
jgi:hypothetical protein